MDPTTWIIILASAIILGQFGVIIALVLRKPSWPTRSVVRPPRKIVKSDLSETRTDHIDIENITHTYDIPDVESSNVKVEETKISSKSKVEQLRDMRKPK